MPQWPWKPRRGGTRRPRLRRSSSTAKGHPTRTVPGRSSSAGTADEVRQQAPCPRRARGDLPGETESDVGPRAAADLGLDERTLLLARVLGEGVGHRDQLHVPRVARLEEVEPAFLHPARPVAGTDAVGPG